MGEQRHNPRAYEAQLTWQSGTAMLAQASRGLDALSSRLRELDSEVSVEKASLAAGVGVAAVGLLASVASRRKSFLAVAGLGLGLAVMQLVTKRAAAAPVGARLGLRPAKEIELEKQAVRYALVALGRGSA